MGYRQMESDVLSRARRRSLITAWRKDLCMNSNAALSSIAHPNREQALKRARLTAGFPNIVNGHGVDSSRRIKISDPVTGEVLASVTDTQQDGLEQAVQAAKAAFPLWSTKTWNERRDLLANAMEDSDPLSRRSS